MTTSMPRNSFTRALRWCIPTLLLAAACGNDAQSNDGQRADSLAGTATSSSSSSSPSSAASSAPAELTSAELDAYARGIAKEIELVKAAQERARTATSPQARGEAAQAQWEDQTIPGGAESAGLTADEYRRVRRTVHHVLQTLDFQGKIDGPMQMDTTHATPEMRKQLTTDPFEELSPSSRTALRERMDKLVPLWVQYVTLTAVAG
jgi:hypothetical protein